MLYGIEVLNTTTTDIQKLENFQKKTLKQWGQVVIPTAHYSDSPFFRHPFLRQPIAPTAHHTDSPLFRQKWSKVV
jgi:hypothetical protein